MRIRKVGSGCALEIDGTFASWYQPGELATGSVWDAIAAPVLLLPKNRPIQVLMLGVAGGSAARVIRALRPKAKITGVELDAAVVQAARRELALDAIGMEIIVADASDYLQRSRRRFDLIIDDLFIGNESEIHKPRWLPNPGFDWAQRRMREGALLVSNCLDEAREVSKSLSQQFPYLLRIDLSQYDNAIFAAGSKMMDARDLRRRIQEEPLLAAALPELRLRRVIPFSNK